MSRRDFLLGLCAAGAGALALRPSRAFAAPKPIVGTRFRLVIDPGHGGENLGCRAHRGGYHEKEITLALAQALAGRVVDLLPHAEVLLTREVDETLHLNQRVAFANHCEADLFLSIHCNASAQGDQRGFETFLLDVEASSREAALTAQRENDEGFAEVGRQRGSEVDTMLRELGMSNNRKLAARYAQAIQAQQRGHFPDRLDRGVRQANFDVLQGARMPAVLHEVGFLDHEAESALLLDAGQRQGIVEALAQATLTYHDAAARRNR